ncbi:MAG: hypothetical protein MPK62_01505 [Alphaproteobacteria bacterium]|nr:hypothetical protein [Alphaproteobacteria bacterium]MDA8029810.1 hypothetical protein [Alphaproteobacteria bacterium]
MTRGKIEKALEKAGIHFADVTTDDDGNFRIEFPARTSEANAGYSGEGDGHDALEKVAEKLTEDAGYEGTLGPVFEGMDGYYIIPR